ncbi:hypothetical protein [Actinomycetospora lemnae]|uniref:Uncharacterized protein n=1 Tax=Actinomycetospora lemnae TaxID=3019891 RepID=A0ABT5SRS2_9PSEU|nr:hypothetical protein [Actinomycetospora sp. DW7H6]MDD7965484.1 hypothetical protein [Actinomycetospora sp. DW7H6]
MAVHIGELRTEIVTPDPITGPGAVAAPGQDPESHRDRARDEARRVRWLVCRVAAEGFDD